MSSSDIKQALKDAKAAIDAANWGEVSRLTGQLLGIDETNGSKEIDSLAPFASYMTTLNPVPKDMAVLYYQTLVFRGMGKVQEAKNVEKDVVVEMSSERARKDVFKDSRT